MMPFLDVAMGQPFYAHGRIFVRTTYEAAANGGKWDRDALDCEPGRPLVPRVVG